MSFWPRSFLDPASEPWRRKVESDIDANTRNSENAGNAISTLSSAVAALRGRLARTPEPKRGSTFILGNGGASMTTTVSFDQAYDSPPVVVAGAAGQGATDSGTSGTGAGTIAQWGNVSVHSVSTTGFSLTIARETGTFSTSTYYFVNWIAYPA